MSWQTVYITHASYVSIKNNHLSIQLRSSQESNLIPLEDINLILMEDTSSTLTSACLSLLANYKIALISCDYQHLPNGIFLPYNQHSLVNQVTDAQINCSLPIKKQLWQQLITRKIFNQGQCLELYKIDKSKNLKKIAHNVLSGDSSNLEARAAILYWKALFGKTFKRLTFHDKEKDFCNACLNYAYAILRGFIARSIAIHGLITNIGINHKNKYNSFNLADDLIEPYRPFIDYYIKTKENIFKTQDELRSIDKQDIITFITREQVRINNKKENIQNSIEELVNSYVKCLKNKDSSYLHLPKFYNK